MRDIATPTLLVSAEDDLYRTLVNAKRAAALMPRARVLSYPTGGHLLLGRGPDLWPRVADFLREGAGSANVAWRDSLAISGTGRR